LVLNYVINLIIFRCVKNIILEKKQAGITQPA
jgi:hypothetical protein